MTTTAIRPVLALAIAAGCMLAPLMGVAAAPLSAASPSGPDFKKLIEEKAPAVVTIKFMMKSEQGEQEEETTGTMIEGSGLVLASNLSLGGMLARMGGAAPTPTDLKVLVGDDTQGVKAKIVARDSELGLAWVQVDDAPTKPYAFIDFAPGAEARAAAGLGDNLTVISLMGKFFDRAPWIAEGRIGAIVKKPRALIIPSLGLRGAELGMPVFDDQGRAIGVTTFILPDQEEMEGNPNGMQTAMRGVTSGMILPSSEVIAATARAKETAKHPPEEKAGEKASDKAGDKPDAKASDKASDKPSEKPDKPAAPK